MNLFCLLIRFAYLTFAAGVVVAEGVMFNVGAR
jgi:hypothetical protein